MPLLNLWCIFFKADSYLLELKIDKLTVCFILVIDNCEADSCNGHGECISTRDSFKCQCEDGWFGETCGGDNGKLH